MAHGRLGVNLKTLQFIPAIAFALLLQAPLNAAAQDAQAGADPNTAAATDARDLNVYIDHGQSSRPFLNKFARNVLLDQKDVWTSPFHINRSTAKWWLLAAGATAALLAADHPISQALPASGTSVNFGNNFSRAGQWYSVFPFAGALYVTGWSTQDDKLRETGALGLESLASAGIVTTILKLATRRERPDAGDHGGHFEKGGASFPSGHSTQAWAIASVVADEYGDHKWVPIVSYTYASAISISRVLAQQHFSSDVFVGGALGFFIGRFVVSTQRTHSGHLKRLQQRGLVPAIVPSVAPGNTSVSLLWSFEQ